MQDSRPRPRACRPVKWNRAVKELAIAPRKADIAIESVALAWVAGSAAASSRRRGRGFSTRPRPALTEAASASPVSPTSPSGRPDPASRPAPRASSDGVMPGGAITACSKTRQHQGHGHDELGRGPSTPPLNGTEAVGLPDDELRDVAGQSRDRRERPTALRAASAVHREDRRSRRMQQIGVETHAAILAAPEVRRDADRQRRRRSAGLPCERGSGVRGRSAEDLLQELAVRRADGRGPVRPWAATRRTRARRSRDRPSRHHPRPARLPVKRRTTSPRPAPAARAELARRAGEDDTEPSPPVAGLGGSSGAPTAMSGDAVAVPVAGAHESGDVPGRRRRTRRVQCEQFGSGCAREDAHSRRRAQCGDHQLADAVAGRDRRARRGPGRSSNRPCRAGSMRVRRPSLPRGFGPAGWRFSTEPTARSTTPSPSTSACAASAIPYSSCADPVQFQSALPSAPDSMRTLLAPELLAARSGSPSPLTSPRAASAGVTPPDPSCSTTARRPRPEWTETVCLYTPSLSLYPPTAISPNPSPSTSPMSTSDEPKPLGRLRRPGSRARRADRAPRRRRSRPVAGS